MAVRKVLSHIAIGVIITPVTLILLTRNRYVSTWPESFFWQGVPGALIGLAAALITSRKAMTAIAALLGGIALGMTGFLALFLFGQIDALDRLTTQDLLRNTLIADTGGVVVGWLVLAIDWLVRRIMRRHATMD